MLGDNIIQSKNSQHEVLTFPVLVFSLVHQQYLMILFLLMPFQWAKLTYGVRSQDSGLCEGSIGGVKRTSGTFLFLDWMPVFTQVICKKPIESHTYNLPNFLYFCYASMKE